ncbi:hypothetical protein [Streptomyces shenzhenensis]|uniref:Uncharacterized protein n=1 Tax=Streptomyces shenzhenensis TaxID=943815 RepID=A0A3M0HYM2_9ACTN|nr:hypothetical protein [Streptomyces shenzhenensis]RMB81298.1 hypothetical protein CTZ28_35450 [Streptomyces shenzhenensis]
MTCELCGNVTSGYLCTRHRERLAAGLQELPALYDEVGECLVPRRSGWGEIVATKSAAGPRSPINEDVLDTVTWGRAAEVMRLWRTDVRHVRWPHRGAPPPGGLAEDCRWLAQQLDWIVAAYPAAGEIAREVQELELQARSVVGDPLPRAQRLGTCVAVTDDQGTVCGAVISRMPGQTRLACRWCGYVYATAQDWARLQHFQPAESA